MARRLGRSGLARFAFVLSIVWSGVALAQANYADALTRLSAAWENLYIEGDAQSVGALYTDDAIYVTSTGTIAEGREQIAGLVHGLRDAGFATIEFERHKTRVMGDVAYAFGHWALIHTEGMVLEGYYTNVYVRTDDGWMFDHTGSSAIEPEEE